MCSERTWRTQHLAESATWVRAGLGWLAPDHVAKHVLQDATVAVVIRFAGGIDAYDCVEHDLLAVLARRRDLHGLRGDALVELLDAFDVEGLGAVELERTCGLADRELQRDNAHADEVGAVDALERLGDDGLDAEQAGALGCPVTRGSGAVLLAAQDDQRDAGCLVVLRRVVDECLRCAFLREVAGVTTGDVVEELVAQTDVRERSANHDLVVTATRAERVVIRTLDAVGVEVLRSGGTDLDRTCRADVVGGDRVAEQCEDASALDVLDRSRIHRHAVEVGWLPHVGGVHVPLEGVTLRGFEVLPAAVARKDGCVRLAEHVLVDRGLDRLFDFLRGRPDVLEVDGVSVGVVTERIGLEVEVHGSGEAVCNHERRGSQVVHLDVGGDTSLEVTVTREHRGDREVVVVDGLRDCLGQGSGVTDARGAAVTAEVVTELLAGPRHRPAFS